MSAWLLDGRWISDDDLDRGRVVVGLQVGEVRLGGVRLGLLRCCCFVIRHPLRS
jgi:hypothetical protein